MNIRRKILAVLMTAAMILTLLPAMAFAEGETGTIPIDAWYEGSLFGEIGDTEMEGMYYLDGSCAVCVIYSEDYDIPEMYYYGEYKYKDENGVEQTREGYLRDGADPSKDESYAYAYIDYDKFEPLKAGANEIPMMVFAPYIDPETNKLEYKEFDYSRRYWVSLEKPIEVKFVPASGFTVEGAVGYNYLDEEDFYGEGNAFEVSYEEPVDPEVYPDNPAPMVITATYEYVKGSGGVEEGFYDGGNPEYERFDMKEGVECYLKKGLNKGVELTYYAYVKGLDDPVALPFTVDIRADKYGLYGEGKISTYTGKAIKKPSFKIYNTDDKVVSSKEYSYKTPKHKKMGWYNLKVTIKSKYRSKYTTKTVTVTYGIGPAAPKLTKVTAGKKKLTVRWKKMSRKQLKQIDGFYVVVSTDKHFLNNVKKVKVSKKTFNSGRTVVKGLKKGKKYYVKMYAYANIKQKGVKFKMPSNDSKVLKKKTK